MNKKFEQMLIQDYSNNPYYKDSPENFLALIALLRENRTQYYHSLTATGCGYKCKIKPYKQRAQPKYRYLGIWIENLLPMLNDPVIKMSTKVKWILDGITSFPKCSVCGKDDYYRTYNVSFGYEYPRTCSIICQNNDPLRKSNLIQSNREVYGYDWPKQNPNIQHKDEVRLMDLSGVTNVFQLDEIKDKSKRTNLINHNNPNWRNVEKISSTRLKFTPEKKHEILEATRQTCYKSLGVYSPFQSEFIRHKSALTYYNATGYWHPSQNPDVRSKSSYRYTFNGNKFDSSYELAFFIYSKANNMNIVRANTRISYLFNNVTRYYFPDFKDILTGRFIEIKGAHFFSEDGKMICPYRYKTWTDEQYEERCDREEAKHKCMIDNNVIIIRTDSICMKYIMSYIAEKYSPSYLDTFRNKQT